MLRILVAIFFWLCAIGVLALSIRAEIVDARGSHSHGADQNEIKMH
ncbi:MAG TPA: hypothetical protein VJQ82_11110 [Terriglobales bacterium]|nr:hypothetical protein [Terriglobales bacterium]